MFGDSDMGVFFDGNGFADSVVQFNGSTANGIMDRPQAIHMADRGFGGFNMELPRLTLPYNAFSPMPAEMDQISVDGQNYTVTEQTAEIDGAIFAYSLKVAP